MLNDILSTPKKRIALLLCTGALSALAMAPVYMFPLLFLSLSLLFWSVKKSSHKKCAFLTGWLFGFGYHVAGLYWIGNALLVEGNAYWWAYPFAVAGLPFVLAFFTGLATLSFHVFCAKTTLQHKWQEVILFAALITITEWFRGFVFTGFPWNLFGYTWASNITLPVLQIVSLIGIYGLTFITILIACLPIIRFDKESSTQDAFFTLSCVVLFVGIALWGQQRLTHNPTEETNTIIRLVQPNIAQKNKWKHGKLGENFEILLDLTTQNTESKPDIILWPETATSFYLNRDPLFQIRLADALDDGVFLMGGVLDIEGKGTDSKVYNRITVWDDRGLALHHYNKSHLVPFGEYIPYGEYIPFNPIAAGVLDFTAGSGIETVDILKNSVIPGLTGDPDSFSPDARSEAGMTNSQKTIPPFSPLVCYEVLFPGKVALDGKERPAWLFNATNDAWYGASSGPYQHLAIARTRAVEEGLPLVRVAGTGVSAVIDPLGRITGQIPLNTQGVLDIRLPKSIDAPLFSRLIK